MKKFSLAVVLMATAGAISCTKQAVPTVEKEGKNDEGDLVTLTVGVSSAATKATDMSDSDEKSVKNLQVFVFTEKGDLERYGADDGSSVEISCFSGNKRIVALVNAPELAATVSNIKDFETLRSELSDNTKGNFVMTGEWAGDVDGDSDISIEVERFAARVVLKKITSEVGEVYLGSLLIKGIYLVNVAGDVPYKGDSEPTDWYNKFENAGEMETLLYDSVNDVISGTGKSYETEHRFYCYPNPTDKDSNETTWCARYTRLVVEAEINNATWYYPISIAGIEANHSYEVELYITGPGVSSPDIEPQIENFKFSVTPKNWEDVYMDTITL